jgi:hypothetical protein
MSILCKNTKNKGVGEWESEKSLQKIERSKSFQNKTRSNKSFLPLDLFVLE